MTCAMCEEYYDCPIRQLRSIRGNMCGFLLRIFKYKNETRRT